VRGVVADHPAVVRILVAMGAEGRVHRIVGQEKTGALDVVHGIEGNGSIGARCRACPGHGCGQRNRTIEALGASGQVQRVQMKGRRAAFESVRQHIQDPACRSMTPVLKMPTSKAISPYWPKRSGAGTDVPRLTCHSSEIGDMASASKAYTLLCMVDTNTTL